MNTSNNGNITKNPFQEKQSTPAQNPSAPVPPTQPSDQKPSSSTPPATKYAKDELAPEDLDAQWTRWKCGVCNYTYEGSKPLKKCPRCNNEDPDKFLDAD